MAENSGIEWTHHTLNPWIGCTKVSAACDFCYAEVWDQRFQGERWGPHAARTKTKALGKVSTWNHKAKVAGERQRVFCSSLADIFDNHKSIQPEWREGLWEVIRKSPNLDFLMLTKRPQNIERYLPEDWGDGYDNVWLGISTENREEMLRRGTVLAGVPGKLKFWSAEPLLGDLGEISDEIMPDWIIAGGENGPDFRPSDPDWFRSIRDQCESKGVPFLFKQWSGKSQPAIKKLGRELDGVIHDGYPISPAAEQPKAPGMKIA